jgi:hypothetical protein
MKSLLQISECMDRLGKAFIDKLISVISYLPAIWSLSSMSPFMFLKRLFAGE